MATKQLALLTLVAMALTATGCPVTVEPASTWDRFHSNVYYESQRSGFDSAHGSAGERVTTQQDALLLGANGRATALTRGELRRAIQNGTLDRFKTEELFVIEAGSKDLVFVNSKASALSADLVIVHEEVRRLIARRGMFTISANNTDSSHTTIVGESINIVRLSEYVP